MSKHFLILLAITGLFACKSSEPRLKTNSRLSAKALHKNLIENRIDFQWFQSKIKADLDQGQPDLNVTVRIRKDSAIWMSITAILGIEVARVLITNDSIKLINRLKKEYNVYSFDYINTISYIALDFQAVQDLLIGNIIFQSDENLKLKTDENFYLLSSFENKLKSDLWIDPAYLLQEMQVSLDEYDQHIKVTYADYQKIGEIEFSHLRDLTLGGENAIHAVLTYSKLKLNVPFTFPFSIPKDYERS